MPRKRIAELLMEKHKRGRDERGLYIIVYDFPSSGGKIPQKFYTNLRTMMEVTGEVFYVQKSVLVSKRLSIARAVEELVRHYGGSPRIFKVERIIA